MVFEIERKIPRRVVLGILMFFACMVAYITRTNFSIIIVAMSDSSDAKKSVTTSVCKLTSINTAKTLLPNYGERYNWDEKIQSSLLSSYFYGVVLSSLPAGILAEKFSGTKVVGYSLAITAILNSITSLAAEQHYGYVFTVRFAMGFFGGSVFPALQIIMARWVPPTERGVFAWTMIGGPGGSFLTFSICGYIIKNFGWKMAFHITSLQIFLFFLIWMYLAYDFPDTHPTITEKEKTLIKDQIGPSLTNKSTGLPISSISTSAPFLALIYLHFSTNWAVNIIAVLGPKYILGTLGFDMASGGIIAGLPYIALIGMGAISGVGGDYLQKNNLMTLLWIRRIFTLFSHVAPAIFLISVSYAECNTYLAIPFLILAFGFSGACCQTSLVNIQDLAPNFAASLYGIMNIFGNATGFIVPSIIGELTKNHDGIEEWRILFFISTFVLVSGTISFWFFGSVTLQPWNQTKSSEDINFNDTKKESVTSL